MSALANGLVAISGLGESKPEGAGFLIDDRLVVTCAHVVNAAIGRAQDETARPGPDDKVAIRFCALPGTQTLLTGTLAEGDDAWKPVSPDPNPDADFCLLKVEGTLPVSASAVMLGQSDDLVSRTFQAVGFPEDWDFDVCHGTIVGEYQGRYLLRPDLSKTPSLLVQRRRMLSSDPERPAGLIHHGFSGGPVLVDGAIVGMVAEARKLVSDATAYMVPCTVFPPRLVSRVRRISSDEAIAVRPAQPGSPAANLVTAYLRIIRDDNLSQLFVARKVVQQLTEAERKALDDKAVQAEESIGDAAARVGKLVLLGEPGLGKSTILKRLDAQTAERTLTGEGSSNYALIPILIELKNYRGQSEIESLLADRVNEVLRVAQMSLSVDSQQSVRIMKTWLSDRAFRFLILLDAMDELPPTHHEQARNLLRTLLNYPHSFIVSCRAADYDKSLAGIAKTFVLVPLNQDDVQDYLKRTLGEKADALFEVVSTSHQLLSLASNALILSMIAEIAPQDMTLLRNRGLLFRAFVKAMIERRRRSGGLLAVAPDIVISAATTLGFEMHNHSNTRPSLGEVRKWPIPKENQTIEAILAEAKKYRLLGSDGFAADPVEFIHPLWSEYFAAEHLNAQLTGNNPDFGKVLDTYIADRSWREVITILFGLLQRPAAFIRWHAAHLAGQAATGALFRRNTGLFGLGTQLRFYADLWEAATPQVQEETRAATISLLKVVIKAFDPGLLSENEKISFWMFSSSPTRYHSAEFESALRIAWRLEAVEVLPELDEFLLKEDDLQKTLSRVTKQWVMFRFAMTRSDKEALFETARDVADGLRGTRTPFLFWF